MTIMSVTSLVEGLRQYRVLEPAQLEEVTARLQARFPEAKALARELLQRNWLTAFQANYLLQGRGQELLLGSYVLMERLGEGGMGQVFKARNWKLGRVVAIKLIRPERLTSDLAVQRFHREVRAAAALVHPNIVLAYDADQIGDIHFLVMEFIDGAIDLARLVKKKGPLPVAQACDAIRQAALGLQHAHEQGLVHRDIKPHNLLLTADGSRIKILDMGLARLSTPPGDNTSNTMTQEGVVMGTPDYIAPEQAMQSHTVDIRADLYSLGCTFYQLLTGIVPFSGDSMMEKLIKHQLQDAEPLEKYRSDVPPAVVGVVRKLMAKKPEDRYQTPVEVAAVLEGILSTGAAPAAEAAQLPPPAEVPPAPPVEAADTVASPFAALTTSDPRPRHHRSQRRSRQETEKLWLLYGGAALAVILIAIVILLALVFRQPAGKKPPAGKKAVSSVGALRDPRLG